MSSMLSSQALVLATAMAVSSTLVFLAFSRQKNFLPAQISQDPNSQQNQIIRPSCLCSGERKRDKKKKKVHFSENIEEAIWEAEETMQKQSKVERSCRNEIRRIPENRVALYNGILKNRMQGMECSY